MEGASHPDGGGTSRGRGGDEVGWALSASGVTPDLVTASPAIAGRSHRAEPSSATRALAVSGRWPGPLAKPLARDRSTASGRYGFTARGVRFGPPRLPGEPAAWSLKGVRPVNISNRTTASP